jgi:hypothetical protein
VKKTDNQNLALGREDMFMKSTGPWVLHYNPQISSELKTSKEVQIFIEVFSENGEYI